MQPQKGDILLCYLTGVKRWVGALEILGPSDDTTPIWKVDEFPFRFAVKPLILLDPDTGVPMEHLEGRLDFYKGPADKGGFKGFLRMSPNHFRRGTDGDLILELLQQAQGNPVKRAVDPRLLRRRPRYIKVEVPKGKSTVTTVVSVPEPELGPAVATPEQEIAATRHTEIQFHLLQLGLDLGLDIWVAKNDRTKAFKGTVLGKMPRMLEQLPTQFNLATTKTVELIDVLWLKGHSIVAAFEVEATTSVYSGLLRMSDLLALQPNLDIRLYVVAPDDRRSKVEQEIRRPTFVYREKPLPDTCGFVSFDQLVKTVEGVRALGVAQSMKPDFLENLAEFFNEDDEAVDEE
jgi:hypothetical protein